MSAPNTFWQRGRAAYRSGRLGSAVYRRLRPWIVGSRYVAHNPAAGRVVLHAPAHVRPDPAERDLVARILTSFKKMKADQLRGDHRYLPASLWQRQLDEAFSSLVLGARDDDIDRVHFFLANFGAWDAYHGVEHSTLVRRSARSLVTKRYAENEIFYRQLKVWEWFYNRRKPLSSLSYPSHGNQSGAHIDGVFVGVTSFFTEIYASMLTGLVRDLPRPVVAELGGGYGRWAYFTLRDLDRFTYVDFDLPETLCLAADHLLRTFPERKALLYGEGPYNADAHREFELILMPSFEIERVGERSVDLFMNIASLGEMTSESASNYVGWMARATRHWLFHINHDVTRSFADENGSAPLASEYPVPEDDFRLVFRYPDLGSMLALGSIDFDVDTFIHLYQRREA